jgi:DNA-binding FadR family transcriptional regulator
VLEQIDGLLKWCRDDQYQGIKRIKQSMDDHENILKAILEGDPDRAKESMSEHIEAIRQIVLKKFLLNQ